MENYTVSNITIVKGAIFEGFHKIWDNNTGTGLDLTNVTLKAELRDKPGGTLLATFTCTKNTPPAGTHDTQGWVKLSLDDSVTSALTAWRGCWSLLMAKTASNYEMTAGGSAEIMRQPTA